MAAAPQPNARERPAVALVTPDPAGRGGMAAVVRGLLASPLAERYELTAITTHRTGSVARRLLVSATGLAQLAVWCLRHPGGVVHVHAAVRGSLYRKSLMILLARALRHPVLLHVHAGPGDIDDFATPLSAPRRALLRIALLRAQEVVSVSAASADAFAAAFALPPVGVIPNAVPPAPAGLAPPDGTRILFLGGFEDPAKGGRDLVALLPRLLEAAPAARLVLAGPGEPPPELERLLGERVAWRGWLDERGKAAALAEAGVVVMPSRSEGMPVVLLEAMAHGRAVVATRVGGIPDLVEDGVDGLLADPGDGDQLVAALRRLASEPALAPTLGDAARTRAASIGGADVIDRLDDAYRRLAQLLLVNEPPLR